MFRYCIFLGVNYLNFDDLLIEADKEGISVDLDYPFRSDLKGLYIDGNIALSNTLETEKEKVCILAEELGHHHTSYGDILEQDRVENRKQEFHARAWAYDKLFGLAEIIESYNYGCKSLYEVATHLDITEAFALEAINYYRKKYGMCTRFEEYIIYFEPSLGVFKMI